MRSHSFVAFSGCSSGDLKEKEVDDDGDGYYGNKDTEDDFNNYDVDDGGDGDGDKDDNGGGADDDLHHHPLYYKASHLLLPRSQGPRCTLATGRSENNNELKILSSLYDNDQHQLIMKEKEH